MPPIPKSKPQVCDQPGSLMLKTILLLKERSLSEVCAETNINFYWLRKFAAMEFENPSVNRVQYLYEYLSGKSIIQ